MHGSGGHTGQGSRDVDAARTWFEQGTVDAATRWYSRCRHRSWGFPGLFRRPWTSSSGSGSAKFTTTASGLLRGTGTRCGRPCRVTAAIGGRSARRDCRGVVGETERVATTQIRQEVVKGFGEGRCRRMSGVQAGRIYQFGKINGGAHVEVRVHTLAQELGIRSSGALARLNDGEYVKGAASWVEPEIAEMLRSAVLRTEQRRRGTTPPMARAPSNELGCCPLPRRSRVRQTPTMARTSRWLCGPGTPNARWTKLRGRDHRHAISAPPDCPQLWRRLLVDQALVRRGWSVDALGSRAHPTHG